MNSSRDMAEFFLTLRDDVQPGCYVFIHPTNGVAILIWLPEDAPLNSQEGMLVDFPIGELIFPNLEECGALARCLRHALRFRLDAFGNLCLNSREIPTSRPDDEDLAAAYAFLSHHRGRN